MYLLGIVAFKSGIMFAAANVIFHGVGSDCCRNTKGQHAVSNPQPGVSYHIVKYGDESAEQYMRIYLPVGAKEDEAYPLAVCAVLFVCPHQ